MFIWETLPSDLISDSNARVETEVQNVGSGLPSGLKPSSSVLQERKQDISMLLVNVK